MNKNQCKQLQIGVYAQRYYQKLRSQNDDPKNMAITKLFQSSFFHVLQECHVNLDSSTLTELLLILSQLVKLQYLQTLHFTVTTTTDYKFTSQGIEELHTPTDKMNISELEKIICLNTTLRKLAISLHVHSFFGVSLSTDIAHVVNSVMKGVAGNKSIQAFSLEWRDLQRSQKHEVSFHITTIEYLLRNNHTLQALQLNIDSCLVPSLDAIEVETLITALEISDFHKLTTLLPRCFKELVWLSLDQSCELKPYPLHEPYPLALLFHSHPNLQQLQLTVYTAEGFIELFTILQSNTTLKALEVKAAKSKLYLNIGPSLQDMLRLNQTIECLDIGINYSILSDTTLSFQYLSFLTVGLSQNTSLQELSVPIPLSYINHEHIGTFFNVISRKNKLTELKVDLKLEDWNDDELCTYNNENLLTRLLYAEGLTLITKMLESHTTITHLQIVCGGIDYDISQSNWIQIAQTFWETVYLHPSLQYIRINLYELDVESSEGCLHLPLLEETLKSQKKTLIDKHEQQLLKDLPIIELIM